MLLSIRTLGASANIVGCDKEFILRRSFMCIKNSKGLELTLGELPCFNVPKVRTF